MDVEREKDNYIPPAGRGKFEEKGTGESKETNWRSLTSEPKSRYQGAMESKDWQTKRRAEDDEARKEALKKGEEWPAENTRNRTGSLVVKHPPHVFDVKRQGICLTTARTLYVTSAIRKVMWRKIVRKRVMRKTSLII